MLSAVAILRARGRGIGSVAPLWFLVQGRGWGFVGCFPQGEGCIPALVRASAALPGRLLPLLSWARVGSKCSISLVSISKCLSPVGALAWMLCTDGRHGVVTPPKPALYVMPQGRGQIYPLVWQWQAQKRLFFHPPCPERDWL